MRRCVCGKFIPEAWQMDGIQSREDYLETIFIISKEQQSVRNADIAARLGFARASVSIAVKKLAAEGFVSVDGNSRITLTEKGTAIAQNVYEKHLILTHILKSLGVSTSQAETDACRLEHCLSDESFGRICEYYLEHLKR